MIGAATPSLQQALKSLTSPNLLIDCRSIAPGDEFSLLPEEAGSMATRSVKARRASGAARIVARGFLARLGFPSCALPKSPTGAPLWPAGVIGSLAHDATIAVAAVARTRDVRGVGVDIELAGPLSANMMGLVVTPAERQRIENDPVRAMHLFVAKEAIYKALHPLDGRFLEYHDISVDLPGNRALTRNGRAIELRFCLSTHIVALALV
jgi:4'-phosphopantetheinyl transferase EntD